MGLGFLDPRRSLTGYPSVDAMDCIGSVLEHVNAVFPASGMGQNQAFQAVNAFIKPLAPMIFITRLKL